MAPRAALRSLLGDDAEMTSYDLPAAHLYSSAAPDSPPRTHRWGVLRWMDATKAYGLTSYLPMEVWLYQPHELGRDYGVLDLAVVRAKELLTQAEQVAGADGWTLCGATWEYSSSDLTDDGFAALVRFVRFRVVGRPVISP